MSIDDATGAALDSLKDHARADLAMLGFPGPEWLIPLDRPDVADAIIVGGGQSGVVIAAALKWDGLRNVRVLDKAPAGAEGPWLGYARMEELRTPKTQAGSEFGVPNLSARRWYETRYGARAWEEIARIPRADWKAYLDWYAGALDISIENEVEAVDVAPDGDLIAVTERRGGRTETRLARVVVLATGFDGAGEWRAPDFVRSALPPARYDHSNVVIDFSKLRGRRVGVLGNGASAFDNSIVALKAGAASADLCFRKARLPRVNPHRALEYSGMMTHFPELSDATRWGILRHFRTADQPPPVRSFQTAMGLEGFRLRPATPWLSVAETASGIWVETPDGSLAFDHIILATGLQVDLAARPELKTIAGRVVVWGERFTPPADEADPRLEALPYLDAHYGFIPRRAEDAWVSRVFAFNGASAVSHGPHSTAISGQKYALPRLVRGVSRRLLLQQESGVVDRLKAYVSDDLPVPGDFEERIIAANRERER